MVRGADKGEAAPPNQVPRYSASVRAFRGCHVALWDILYQRGFTARAPRKDEAEGSRWSDNVEA
jgi:hypothetical protein